MPGNPRRLMFHSEPNKSYSAIQNWLGVGRWVICLWALICFAPASLAQDKTATTTPAPAAADTNVMYEATNHLGKWIWDSHTADKQTVRLWQSFVIPPGATVSSATITITVDNGYRLFLDGHELGRGSDWRTLTQYDVKWLLYAGTHVIAVEGFNDRLEAGLIFGLRINLVDQSVIQVSSDDSWKIVPLTTVHWENIKHAAPDWPSASIMGVMGSHGWGSWPYGVVTEPPVRLPVLRFWQTPAFQISVLSLLVVVLLLCLWLMAQLVAQVKSQRLLQLQRARIARDIHDDLGARLTQLVLLGELAQSELPSQSETRAQIDQICERARDLANAMNEVVWAVSSRRDTLRDFAAYVCNYAQLFLKDTPIRCRLDLEPDLPAVPFDLAVRRNLLLAVKEAINNTAKHSGASELFLRIHRQGGYVRVVVEDNGKGFDVEQADSLRNGLMNMAQRMQEVGGRFSMSSAPGAGCTVEFRMPLTLARQRLRWLSWLWRDRSQAAETGQRGEASGQARQETRSETRNGVESVEGLDR
jgi:signal transduction histidine kinase